MPATQTQQHGIFINYRRSDTRADAGRLYDGLATRFGSDHVFIDVDDINPGQNFKQVLQDTLASCRVMLVLIGPQWLAAPDSDELPRLHEEDDIVRQEVATALRRSIPVVPVLFNRARMPDRDQLPHDLTALADCQALEVSDTRFHEDLNELARVLGPLLGDGAAPRFSRRSLLGLITGALLILLPGLFWMHSDQRQAGEPADPTALGALAPPPALELRSEAAMLGRAAFLGMLANRGFFDAGGNPDGAGTNGHYELRLVADDAVVTDSATGLMWQQNHLGKQLPYSAVAARIASMNDGAFAGYDDWRLPTVEELVSLLTPQQAAGAHMSPLLAPSDAPIVWSADWLAQNARWLVYIYEGRAAAESPAFNAWVRAVRTSPVIAGSAQPEN